MFSWETFDRLNMLQQVKKYTNKTNAFLTRQNSYSKVAHFDVSSSTVFYSKVSIANNESWWRKRKRIRLF